MTCRYFHTPGWEKTAGTFCLEIWEGGAMPARRHQTDYTNIAYVNQLNLSRGQTLMNRAEVAVERGNWFEICLLPYMARGADVPHGVEDHW